MTTATQPASEPTDRQSIPPTKTHYQCHRVVNKSHAGKTGTNPLKTHEANKRPKRPGTALDRVTTL